MNDEFDTEINAELFDNDIDEIGWEPEVIDDSNDDAKKKFGYK